jgi:hypothetical protein
MVSSSNTSIEESSHKSRGGLSHLAHDGQALWRPSLVSGIDSHASRVGSAAELAPPGHRGAFTPIPAASPALHAVFGTTCGGLRGRCRSNARQHSRDVLRDRFLAPVVGAWRRIVAHVAPAPGRRHDPTISPYASCCSSARPFPSG